jgi:hypothetical protein
MTKIKNYKAYLIPRKKPLEKEQKPKHVYLGRSMPEPSSIKCVMKPTQMIKLS